MNWSNFRALENGQDPPTLAFTRYCYFVAEFQPLATSATLNLLALAVEQAEATNAATDATIQEIRGDLNLL